MSKKTGIGICVAALAAGAGAAAGLAWAMAVVASRPEKLTIAARRSTDVRFMIHPFKAGTRENKSCQKKQFQLSGSAWPLVCRAHVRFWCGFAALR